MMRSVLQKWGPGSAQMGRVLWEGLIEKVFPAWVDERKLDCPRRRMERDETQPAVHVVKLDTLVYFSMWSSISLSTSILQITWNTYLSFFIFCSLKCGVCLLNCEVSSDVGKTQVPNWWPSQEGIVIAALK